MRTAREQQQSDRADPPNRIHGSVPEIFPSKNSDDRPAEAERSAKNHKVEIA